MTQGSELWFDLSLRSQDDAGFAAPLVLSPQPADIARFLPARLVAIKLIIVRDNLDDHHHHVTICVPDPLPMHHISVPQ